MVHFFPKKIRALVAIDGSINNWAWLKRIKEYINVDNCRLTLICVCKHENETTKAKEILDLTLALMDEENFLFMHEDSFVKVGDPARVILDTAHNNDYDYIILGSHNKQAVERFFMGSVSTNVVNHSHIPVLIMKL